MSDPLAECNAAITELHLTDVYKRRKSQAQYDGTHTGLAEKHVKAAIAGLTVTPPPPDPPPPPTSGGLPVFAAPAFTVTRNRPCANQTELQNAVNSRQAGDLITATGFPILGEFTIQGGPTTGKVRCQFVNAPFKGAPKGSQLPALWLNNAVNLELLGVDVTGLGNQGVLIHDGDRVLVQGKSHDNAGTGLSIFGISKPSNGVEVWLELWNNGLDLSLDPHAEKGTGNHGVNVGGGTGQPVTNAKLVLDIHDQPYGAALQWENLRNSEVWLRTRNITFVATQQTGGNAMQGWGSGSSNVHFRYIEADNVAQVVKLALGSGNSGITVDYARATRVRLSPAYESGNGVTLGDVQPRP